jgi:hypothetical protein
LLRGLERGPFNIYSDIMTRRKINSALQLFPFVLDITVTWGQVSEQAWLAINIGNNTAEFQGYTPQIFTGKYLLGWQGHAYCIQTAYIVAT